eukprot:10446723-Alexandrium_andersonii.AAC.1
MSASLVGSEMCIRDRQACPLASAVARAPLDRRRRGPPAAPPQRAVKISILPAQATGEALLGS